MAILERYPGRAGTVHLKPYSKALGQDDPHKGFQPVIGDDDLVFLRAYTAPIARGRGVFPALMLHAIEHDLVEDAQSYADAKVYNKPSLRAMRKAGFVQVATRKPLRREEVLS